MPGASLVSVIEWASLVGSLLTAFKLHRTGLYRRYRVFFAYFLFRVANAVFPLLLDRGSPAYFRYWIFSQPVVWVFYVWVVLELCRLVLEKHRGLYTLGKWA